MWTSYSLRRFKRCLPLGNECWAPRIRVTLATEITKERCQQVNLGYLDYHEIDPTNWLGREHEGVLVIPNAGEVLYRIGSSAA